MGGQRHPLHFKMRNRILDLSIGLPEILARIRVAEQHIGVFIDNFDIGIKLTQRQQILEQQRLATQRVIAKILAV